MRQLRIRLEDFSHGRDPNRHFPVPEYGFIQIRKGQIIKEINQILAKYDQPQMQLLRVASDIGLYPNLVRFILQDEIKMKDMETETIDESLLGYKFTPGVVNELPVDSPTEYRMPKLESRPEEVDKSPSTNKEKNGNIPSANDNGYKESRLLEERRLEKGNGGLEDDGGEFDTANEEDIQFVEQVRIDESQLLLMVDPAIRNKNSVLISLPRSDLNSSGSSYSSGSSTVSTPPSSVESSPPSLPSFKPPSPKRKKIDPSPPLDSLPLPKAVYDDAPITNKARTEYGDSTPVFAIPTPPVVRRDYSALHKAQRENLMRLTPKVNVRKRRPGSPVIQPLAEGLIDFSDLFPPLFDVPIMKREHLREEKILEDDRMREKMEREKREKEEEMRFQKIHNGHETQIVRPGRMNGGNAVNSQVNGKTAIPYEARLYPVAVLNANPSTPGKTRNTSARLNRESNFQGTSDFVANDQLERSLPVTPEHRNGSWVVSTNPRQTTQSTPIVSPNSRINTTPTSRISPVYRQGTNSSATVSPNSPMKTPATCIVSPSTRMIATPASNVAPNNLQGPTTSTTSARETPPSTSVVSSHRNLTTSSSTTITHPQLQKLLTPTAVSGNSIKEAVAPSTGMTVGMLVGKKKSHHKKVDGPKKKKKKSTLAGTTMHVPDGSDETLTHTRCNICNVWFEKEGKQKIRYHVLYHCPIKQYQCALCHYSHHEVGKIKRHRSTVHKDAPPSAEGEEVKNHQNVLTQACYDVFMKRAFPNYDTGKLTIGRSINYPNQVEELHECAICEKRVYKSLTAYHFVDKHEKQLVYNCELCKFKSVFKQRLEIHYQACHDCDHVGDFFGTCIDFRDPTTYLIKDVFPSFVDINDPKCEQELVTMAFIASGAVDIKTKKKLLAVQDGLADAHTVRVPKNIKCEGCHHDGMLVEAENLYDLFFHMKSHMSGRNQWCCPKDDCVFTATTKLGVDLHIYKDHKKAYLGSVVNRWSILQDDWKKLFTKCFPTVAHLYPTIKGIEFDARANEEKYK